ncbi:uncharacterized protein LOC121386028 [Gigantopelta aegis]|uniref:uncharacterized protein LOC121386028 n=1 Tax=Gigantopelta aegis TaxID=1735272 RepID=UPI001B88AEA7|nr:uncharacterized protein LOC121386028 [Gigantopelta aegis]
MILSTLWTVLLSISLKRIPCLYRPSRRVVTTRQSVPSRKSVSWMATSQPSGKRLKLPSWIPPGSEPTCGVSPTNYLEYWLLILLTARLYAVKSLPRSEAEGRALAGWSLGGVTAFRFTTPTSFFVSTEFPVGGGLDRVEREGAGTGDAGRGVSHMAIFSSSPGVDSSDFACWVSSAGLAGLSAACWVQCIRSGTLGPACTKFDEDTTLEVAVEVSGACYYGFSVGMQYTSAEQLCQSQGAHLVHLETEQKQHDVWNALGPNFGQHWMGLKFVGGSWVWWDNGQSTAVTSSRWESDSSGACAYTNTDNNRGLWKAAELTNWYRTVCEDGSSAVAEETSLTTTTGAPTTPTVPGGVMYASFVMTSSLSDVVEIDTSSSAYNLECARKCYELADCQFYKFFDNTCNLYNYQSAGIGISCGQGLRCYRREY